MLNNPIIELRNKRMAAINMAMQGEVLITLKCQHGSPYSFRASLVEACQVAATRNSQLYYSMKSKEELALIKLLKANKKLARKARLKALEDNGLLSFSQRVVESLKTFSVVNTDTFRWQIVSSDKIESVVFLG